MAIIVTDKAESGPPNVLELHQQLRSTYQKNLSDTVSSAVSSLAGDYRYTAEFDAFYRRADLLRKVSKKHSWTRATVSSIARATIGAGFKFVSHPVYGKYKQLTQNQMNEALGPVFDFFYGVQDASDDYIQDIIPLPNKLYYTIVSLIYYGQAAWEIIYDRNTGLPVRFDVLAGIVRPNVDSDGKFLRPAYYFRPWNSQTVISYKNPKDLFYVTWPGTDFSIYGSTEYESLAEITIPSDLYASSAYRNHFENVNAPYNGFWVVSKDTSPEDYKAFLMTLVNRYAGVVNYGRTPIVIKGDAEFKETRSRSNDDAPYLQGRQYNQEEISAVSAVPSAKLGLAANTTKTNYREMRRDFHENTLRPVFEIVEQAIYRQIMVRGFGIKDWMLAFNSPDLTTSIEQATILARYIREGVLTPNEAREELGRPPREDEYGNMFYHPSNSTSASIMPGDLGVSGLRAEQEREPDGGSMRQMNSVRIPRESQPRVDESAQKRKEEVVSELKRWRAFAVRVAAGKRPVRKFVTDVISEQSAASIQEALEQIGDDIDLIKDFFNSIIDFYSTSDLTNF